MDTLARLGEEVAAGRLIAYLGPGLLGGDAPVPAGARDLSRLLAAGAPVPGRIRDNLWHTAQYIETHRHRMTLDRLAAEAFRAPVPPRPLHRWLAGLDVPLIVDTWYDGAMTAALAGRDDWGVVQGASKARRVDEAPWFRAFDPRGRECPAEAAAAWRTVVYKPHGAAGPAGDMLLSDADYVEVLSEIDIQTPIPAVVQARRTERGFLFVGCRFYDQILRTFARSIMRRSGGPHWAVLPAAELTPNERRFLEAEAIQVVDATPDQAATILAGVDAAA